MNAFIIEIVLMLLRHGLTAVGFSKVVDDPETMNKLAGAVVMGLGIAWSAWRKVHRVSAPAQITPIPPTPPKP